MGKISKGDLLRMEAEVADLEEALPAAKTKHPRCSECDRPLPERMLSKAQIKTVAQIRDDKAILHAARRKFREERAKHAPPPPVEEPDEE